MAKATDPSSRFGVGSSLTLSLNVNANNFKCILFLSLIIVILSTCPQEASSSRGSRRRHHISEHHHHYARSENSDNSNGNDNTLRSSSSSDAEDEAADSGLRRIPGKYICLEDDDERDRLRAKNEMHCKCPKMYAPVCGSDAVTYHNRCFMQCVSKYKYEGFSRVKLQVEKWGPCDEDHEMPVQD